MDELEEEGALLADGMEAGLIGVVRRCGQPTIALYDRDKCIESLVKEGMSYEEAEEYFSFNTEGAWVGEMTPAWAELRRKGDCNCCEAEPAKPVKD
jgi:hypothetical protein